MARLGPLSLVLAGLLAISPPVDAAPATVAESSTGPGAAAEATPSGQEAPGRVMARAKQLLVLVPARKHVALAYHESLFGTAVAMVPKGRPRLIDHPGFRPPKRTTPRPRYLVMASRGRGTPASSAVDVVLRRGTRVLAPVTGRVVDTSSYRLYCRRLDRRVIIRPDAAPRMRVVIFHVERVRVRKKEQVVAGQTRLGKPREFGLTAQYDSYVGGNHPHVHVEVERRPTRPTPGCR